MKYKRHSSLVLSWKTEEKEVKEDEEDPTHARRQGRREALAGRDEHASRHASHQGENAKRPQEKEGREEGEAIPQDAEAEEEAQLSIGPNPVQSMSFAV